MMLINIKKKKVQVIAQPASTSAAATEITQAMQAENADLPSASSFVGDKITEIHAEGMDSPIPTTEPVKVAAQMGDKKFSSVKMSSSKPKASSSSPSIPLTPKVKHSTFVPPVALSNLLQGPVYDVDEAAQVANVCTKTIIRWIKNGKLPAGSTPGGHYRIPKKALHHVLFGKGNWDPANDP